MTSQAELIHDGDFDSLLILDATRYDIFSQVCKLKGELRKVKSNAQHTQFWLQRTFTDKYDYHYITAHPYINKVYRKGVWNSTDHFEEDKIHEVWRQWDDSIGTVHPNKVGFEVAKIDYDKAIIHYIQPHGPWIGRHGLGNEWALEDFFHTGQMADGFVVFTKPEKNYFKLAYKDNLRLVLDSVEKFKKYFKGKTVITADHGEMLGEKGYYLHKERYHKDKENPDWVKRLLMDVPWFIWDK